MRLVSTKTGLYLHLTQKALFVTAALLCLGQSLQVLVDGASAYSPIVVENSSAYFVLMLFFTFLARRLPNARLASRRLEHLKGLSEQYLEQIARLNAMQTGTSLEARLTQGSVEDLGRRRSQWQPKAKLSSQIRITANSNRSAMQFKRSFYDS